MCKFSIIIPTYNEEKYIIRCLESILNQTIDSSHYEIIVIDDGSTDKTVCLCKQYPVKLLSSNRLGAGGARNKGLDNAKGEYILLLDGDDYLDENTVLERLEKELKKEDVVFVKYKEIRKNDEKIVQENAEYTLGEQIEKSDYFCCTLKCFRREIAEDIRYKERSYHEDIAFTVELMCKAKTVFYFDNILYVYDKTNNDTTVSQYNVRKALDFMTQTLEYFYLADKYEDKKPFLINRINLENYVSKVNRLSDWIKNDKEYTYKEFLKGKEENE